MKGSRHRVWAVALCVMALGVLGVGASSAQAKPNWNVNGAAITAGLLPTGTINSSNGILLSTIVGIATAISCTETEAIGAHLVANNKILGTIKFKKCTIKLNGTLSSACEPHEGAEKGVVLTKESEGELKAGKNSTVLKPKAGTEFATVHTSAKCAVGEEIPIEGQLAVEDTGGLAGLEAESVEHTIKENVAETVLTALGEPATIDGTAKVALSGAHNAQKWSGKP